MSVDTTKLTPRFTPKYVMNEKVINDFCRIIITFMYGGNVNLECEKYSFREMQEMVWLFCKKFKHSLTWNFIRPTKNEKYKLLNPVNKVGHWLWSKGLRYPNVLYDIFPPYFGNRHILFMDTMFGVLNAFEMPRSDWYTLLMHFDGIKNKEDREFFKKLIDDASSLMYQAYLAEMYEEYRIFANGTQHD